MDQWEREYAVLIQLEMRDKSVTQLAGLAIMLAEVEE
jgi:hypothetical protein